MEWITACFPSKMDKEKAKCGTLFKTNLHFTYHGIILPSAQYDCTVFFLVASDLVPHCKSDFSNALFSLTINFA